MALHLNLFDFFGDASGVGSFDQKDFFLATPTLELLFAGDGFADYVSPACDSGRRELTSATLKGWRYI